MHHYQFEAASQDGEVVRGVLTAPDLITARNSVEARLLQPLRVLEIPDDRADRQTPAARPSR
jgi:hypothetical protein